MASEPLVEDEEEDAEELAVSDEVDEEESDEEAEDSVEEDSFLAEGAAVEALWLPGRWSVL